MCSFNNFKTFAGFSFLFCGISCGNRVKFQDHLNFLKKSFSKELDIFAFYLRLKRRIVRSESHQSPSHWTLHSLNSFKKNRRDIFNLFAHKAVRLAQGKYANLWQSGQQFLLVGASLIFAMNCASASCRSMKRTSGGGNENESGSKSWRLARRLDGNLTRTQRSCSQNIDFLFIFPLRVTFSLVCRLPSRSVTVAGI